MTYIPMAKAVLCWLGIIDWYSRKVLALELLSSMGALICVDVSERRGPIA